MRIATSEGGRNVITSRLDERSRSPGRRSDRSIQNTRCRRLRVHRVVIRRLLHRDKGSTAVYLYFV